MWALLWQICLLLLLRENSTARALMSPESNAVEENVDDCVGARRPERVAARVGLVKGSCQALRFLLCTAELILRLPLSL